MLMHRSQVPPDFGGMNHNNNILSIEVDHVPPSSDVQYGKADLCVMEDSEGGISIIVKQRWSQVRHAPRTHRTNFRLVV